MNISDEVIVTIVGLALMLIPTIVLTWYYLTRIRDKKSAYYHKQVQKQLKRVAAVRKQKVLQNVTIAYAGKTGEFSHLLIGPFGILVVTVLDKRGVYYGDARGKSWIHDNTKVRTEIPNPYLSAQKTIELMRGLFGKNEIYSVPVEQIVVYDSYAKKSGCFVGNEINAMRLSQLKSYLEREKFEKDNGVNVEKICALFSEEDK